MSDDRFDVLERFTPLFDAPQPSFEQFVQRRDRQRRRRHIAAGIGGALASVALVAIMLTALPFGDDPTPHDPTVSIAVSETTAVTTTSTSSGPAGASAVEVANGFVAAHAAHDADAVIGYLADDFVGGQALGDFGRYPEEIRVWLSLNAAQRGENTLQPCVEVDSSADGVEVRCPFDAHAFGSDELGFGPYTGQTWIITVRDDKIVAARTEWNNIEHMTQEVVEPFGQWVQANHPDDFAVMYIDGNPLDFRLSEAAVRLWEQHLGEYVAEQKDELDTAEAFMAAWVDGDGDDVAELLGADGTWEDFTAETLGGVHDWNRAVGAAYQTEECVQRPVLQQIGCSYTLENDLSRFIGADPEAESFAFDIAAGEIASVRDTYDAREDGAWETFHQWIAEHHPGDVERMYTADSRFAKWDATSIGLWERHLHDFIASSDGYIARAESICTAAHERFNDEMEAAGIDMEPSPDDDGSGLQLIPSNAEDVPAAEEVSRRVEREALIELYAVVTPEDVLHEFDEAYRRLEQFSEGNDVVEPEELWRQVRDMELGLDHCTFPLTT